MLRWRRAPNKKKLRLQKLEYILYIYLAVNGSILLNVPPCLLAQCFEHIVLVCMLRQLVVAVSPQPSVYLRSDPPPLLFPTAVVLPLPWTWPPVRRCHRPISPSPPHRPWPNCLLYASLLNLRRTFLSVAFTDRARIHASLQDLE